MPNPTMQWDQMPVWGVYDDTGDIVCSVATRVRRQDGLMIYPGGKVRQVTIGDQASQDAAARSEVRTALRAKYQASNTMPNQPGPFDGTAWDVWWDTDIVPRAVFMYFYLSDDPDVTPNGWQVMVEERLQSKAGKTYPISTESVHLGNEIPGVNLGLQDPPPGSPSAPAPVYAKGQPGGIAPLGADGLVPAEHLPGDLGGAAELTSYSTQVAALPDYPAAFPPAGHGHAQSEITGLPTALAAKADLVGGVIPTSQLPPLAVNETFTAASQAAMLALTAQRGDMAIRTDNGRTYVLASDSPSTLADWKEVQAAGQVVSVAGKTGTVALTASDVGIATATTSAAGLVELATTTEATTGTDTVRAVTPAGLKAGLDGRVGGGLVFLGYGATPPDPTGLPDGRVWFLTGA